MKVFTVLTCVLGLSLSNPQSGSFVSHGSLGVDGAGKKLSKFRSTPKKSFLSASPAKQTFPTQVAVSRPVQTVTNTINTGSPRDFVVSRTINGVPVPVNQRPSNGRPSNGRPLDGRPGSVSPAFKSRPVGPLTNTGIPLGSGPQVINAEHNALVPARKKVQDTFFNKGSFKRTGRRGKEESRRTFSSPVRAEHHRIVESVNPQLHNSVHNIAPVVHHDTHNTAPVGVVVSRTVNGVPVPVEHHDSHNLVHQTPEVHHGSHGSSYGHDEGYGYEEPDPFHFEYGVHDDHYYTDFRESREGDEYGNIHGEYEVALPDGRIQYVHYSADGQYGGTIMDVEYKGEARHPESYGGYSGGYHAEHGALPDPSHHQI